MTDETVYTTYQHERQLYDQERESLDNSAPACGHFNVDDVVLCHDCGLVFEETRR